MDTETPVQEIDLEAEFQDLLCIALDGTDTDRVRFLIQFMAMRHAQDRPIDLDGLVQSGIRLETVL